MCSKILTGSVLALEVEECFYLTSIHVLKFSFSLVGIGIQYSREKENYREDDLKY